MSDSITPSVPVHIGFIMDGNRRWAKERGLLPMQGHEAGVDVFHAAVRTCFDQGAKYVSAYAFSTENWARAEEEVKFLMALVPRVLKRYLKEFNRDNIRITVLGSRENLSKSVLKAIDEAESTTSLNTAGTVALCFNYGGKQELLDMIKLAVESDKKASELTLHDVQGFLYHPEIPPCDLIVRASGEKRISGFMLPRSEYAEFIFEDKYWPDITPEDVKGYIEEYAARCRRFGQ